jgi:hypothetical protein
MPAIDLNTFSGLAPVFEPATNRFGLFLSDPKCSFDPGHRHWFTSCSRSTSTQFFWPIAP